MIPNVEEFRPELEVHLLANREELENRKIPILQARPAHDVSAFIAESEEDVVGCEGTGVKQGPRHTVLAVRIPNNVRSLNVFDRPTAVAGGNAANRAAIGNGEPVASLRRGDAGHLPIPDDLVQNAAGIPTELLSVSERRLIGIIDDKAMAHINVRIAVFQSRILLVAEITVVEGAEAGAGSVVKGVGVGILRGVPEQA
jgi:hypothetical protein